MSSFRQPRLTSSVASEGASAEARISPVRPATSASVIRLDDQLCFAVYAASRAMTTAYRDLLKGSDLTYPQYVVMISLWEQDGVTTSELCQRVSLDFGTLTPLLKRLETRGVLKRVRDLQDERIVRLVVTSAGHQLKKKVADAPQKLRCKISLSRDETALLRIAMRTLIKDLKREG